MYENVTYEDILKRMLSRVSADLDKREGSILYDALAPAAMEMQMMYLQIPPAVSIWSGGPRSAG